MELCASCGKESTTLNDITGWCAGCTLSFFKNSDNNGDSLLCYSCGELFKRAGQFRSKCPSCRENDWQEANADRIERWMGTGLPYELARLRVLDENRPNCLGCGKPIKHGTKGRHIFCSTTQRCRKLYRRYKYLKEHYILTREQAIERTMQIQQEIDLVEARKQVIIAKQQRQVGEAA